MATPTGYIDATDGGWPVATAGEVNIRCDFRLPLEPPQWGGGTAPRLRLSMWRQIYVPAAATLTEWVSTQGAGGPQVDETDTVNGVYQEYDSDFGFPRQPSGVELSAANFSSTSYSPNRTYAIARADSVDAACEILALYFEMTPAEDFNTPEPVDNADYEIYGTNVAVWAPYTSGSCASAYEAKYLLSRNQNKISYETSPAWSVVL